MVARDSTQVNTGAQMAWRAEPVNLNDFPTRSQITLKKSVPGQKCNLYDKAQAQIWVLSLSSDAQRLLQMGNAEQPTIAFR
jgi:hypothetical protein